MTNPAIADGGHTWGFTVTSEDEKTTKIYPRTWPTISPWKMRWAATVTAAQSPAREGDTLTVTQDPRL